MRAVQLLVRFIALSAGPCLLSLDTVRVIWLLLGWLVEEELVLSDVSLIAYNSLVVCIVCRLPGPPVESVPQMTSFYSFPELSWVIILILSNERVVRVDASRILLERLLRRLIQLVTVGECQGMLLVLEWLRQVACVDLEVFTSVVDS